MCRTLSELGYCLGCDLISVQEVIVVYFSNNSKELRRAHRQKAFIS